MVNVFSGVLRSLVSCVVVSESLDGASKQVSSRRLVLRVKRRRAGWSADGDIGKALVLLLMYVYIKSGNPHALYSIALSPPAARVQRCPSRMQRSLTDIILSVAEYAETN